MCNLQFNNPLPGILGPFQLLSIIIGTRPHLCNTIDGQLPSWNVSRMLSTACATYF